MKESISSYGSTMPFKVPPSEERDSTTTWDQPHQILDPDFPLHSGNVHQFGRPFLEKAREHLSNVIEDGSTHKDHTEKLRIINNFLGK